MLFWACNANQGWSLRVRHDPMSKAVSLRVRHDPMSVPAHVSYMLLLCLCLMSLCESLFILV